MVVRVKPRSLFEVDRKEALPLPRRLWPDVWL
jgi:hypothetical protein